MPSNGPFTEINAERIADLRAEGASWAEVSYRVGALLKNIPLPKEGMKLQFRAEFYNLFNHPNLYVSGGTDVNASPFTRSDGQAVPGVTASFRDSRQIVMALKLIF